MVYNLGTGCPTTVRTLLSAIKESLGLPPNFPVLEQLGAESDQFGAYADISAIQADLAWKPKTSLAEGLAKMVAWAKT